jgi:hypothetical protein
MKKHDEIALWNLFKIYVDDGLINTHACMEMIGMNLNRGYYLIHKWTDDDLIEWGVGERWVWFTPKGLNTPILIAYP